MQEIPHLTERENALKAYRHELPERVPCAPTSLQLCGNSGFWEHPPYKKPGKDWFGLDWIDGEAGAALMPDHQKPPMMDDICDWREKIHFPDLDNWDWEHAVAVDKPDQCDRENKLVTLTVFAGPFERMHMLMGFENALCALLTEPEEVSAFLDALMEYKLKLIDKLAQYYKPDVLTFHDDYGTQLNLFFSPEIFRELFKPQLKKAVDRCHEHGMFFELHSCGEVSKLIPDFVELGCDSFQGMDIVNIPKMKAITGDKLLYQCALNYQRYQAESLAGTLTEEALRADIRESLMKNAEGGCYIPRFSFAQGKEWWSKVLREELTEFCNHYRY